MSIKFKPYGNNVLIKMDPPEETIFGMSITAKKEKTSQTGEIIAVGEGSVDNPMNLVAGKKAFIIKNAGQVVSKIINDNPNSEDEYRVIDRNHVLGTY